MKTEIVVISVIALIGIAFFAYLEGLDIRKPLSWIYGATGVLLLILNLGLSIKTIVIAVSLVVFIWIVLVVSIQGLDLRKRASWFYGAYGFLCELALGTAISDDFVASLNVGAIFAFMILFVGATMRRHNQKYGRR